MIARRAFLIGIFVTAAALAASLIAYPHLADQMPVHWNMRGEVDSYGDKQWAAFFGPGALVLLLLLWKALPAISPRQFEVETFRGTYDFVMLLVVAFFGYIHALMLWAGLAGGVDVGRALVGGIFLLFALLGNVLGKVRRNFWMGVRTPWTLGDEKVWNDTHRYAAKIYTGAGVAGVVAVIAGVPLQYCFTVLIFALMLPAVYSFVLFRRSKAPSASSAFPWLVGLLVLAAFCGGLYALLDASMPRAITVTPAMRATAVSLVDNAAGGDYEAATKDFDSAMRNALPPSGLQSAWESVTAEHGPFVRRDGVNGRRLGGYDAVFVRCEFRKGSVNVKVVLDGGGRVTGLWFGP